MPSRSVTCTSLCGWCRCILRGIGGCSRNPAVARGWLLAAAEKHHRTALYQLGTLCEVGLLGPVDLAAAEKYYRLGAELGSDHAGNACFFAV